MLCRVPTTGVFDKYGNNFIIRAVRQPSNCKTLFTNDLYGQYPHSETLAKCLPGHCDRVPTYHALDHPTHQVLLVAHTNTSLLSLSSMKGWLECKTSRTHTQINICEFLHLPILGGQWTLVQVHSGGHQQATSDFKYSSCENAVLHKE